MNSRYFLPAVLVTLILTLQCARAGNLVATNAEPIDYSTYQPDPNRQCTHKFSGKLQSGDAEKIINSKPTLLCLNSPGGSLVEALKLTTHMNSFPIATKIDSGAVCESSCALIFMAGLWQSNEARSFIWRTLHPAGRLGFHSPAILIDDRLYSKHEVEKAYNIALKSISGIISNLIQREEGGVAMASSLLGQMLETPANDMFYIDTIDKAGRWDIQVGPVRAVRALGKRQLMRACINAHTWNSGKSAVGIHPSDYGDPNGNGDDIWSDAPEQKDGHLTGIVSLSVVLYQGCSFDINTNTTPNSVRMTLDFNLNFESETRMKAFPILYRDPDSLLSDLVVAPSTSTNSKSGICTVFNEGNQIDKEPCKRFSEIENNQSTLIYLWPSGAKTYVQIQNGNYLINGNRTSPEENFKGRSCVMNPKSGNLFCFSTPG